MTDDLFGTALELAGAAVAAAGLGVTALTVAGGIVMLGALTAAMVRALR